MDAKFLILAILLPIICLGQKTIYPRDTIYIKFEDKIGSKKWNAKLERTYKNKHGFFFNVEDSNGDMALFYDQEQSSDTLCYRHLKDYQYSNLKEIDKRRNEWIFKNKRPPANKNGVFKTFVIEIISKEKFVIYPVIWRNEKL